MTLRRVSRGVSRAVSVTVTLNNYSSAAALHTRGDFKLISDNLRSFDDDGHAVEPCGCEASTRHLVFSLTKPPPPDRLYFVLKRQRKRVSHGNNNKARREKKTKQNAHMCIRIRLDLYQSEYNLLFDR